MKEFFEQRRPHDGLTYDQYLEYWQEQTDRSMKDLDRDERKMMHYYRYNWDRSEQVMQEYEPSADLRESVQAIDEAQLWMVITEPWCGDSAFNLPVIVKAADLNDDVELRILLRDENLDVMDQYLTGGSRSIPKLVAFASDGQERFTWGPRPDAGQEVFDRLKAAGKEKTELIQDLIAWYEDGGYEHVDTELAETIHSAVGVER